MRKILCALLLIAFLFQMAPARAEAYFQMEASVIVGLRGREAAAVYDRRRSGPAGYLYALDESGALLGSCKVSSGDKCGSIILQIPEDAPAGQTVYFYFRHDDRDDYQCQCLLAADTARDDGVYRGDPNKMQIAITFDAAFGEGRLDALLKVLDKYQARCTFFLQGDFVLGHPDLVARIDAMGHEIGNHTMHHPDDIRELDNENTYWEIKNCNDAIEAITGKPVTLYRPPAGYSSYRDRAISRALGCEVILWTFDSLDGFLTTSSKQTVWNALSQKTVPGAIILMHIYGYYTPELLDQYIPIAQGYGYEFVTVSELLADPEA